MKNSKLFTFGLGFNSQMQLMGGIKATPEDIRLLNAVKERLDLYVDEDKTKSLILKKKNQKENL